MKKIFCLLIITLLMGLYINPIKTNANQVLEKGVREIDLYGEFNYFRGVTAEEFLEKGQGIFYNYFDSCVEDGEIKTRVVVENIDNREYHFDFTYIYSDEALTTAKVFFENTLIYEAYFDIDEIREVKVCKQIIVEEETTVKDDYFTIVSYQFLEASNEYTLDQSELEKIGMFLIRGHKYIYNETYKGQEVYFVTSIENLISFEDIKTKLSATDATDGDLTDKIEIYNNTYDPTSDKITIGNYKFDAVVYDSSGNTVYQTCYVKVVDLQAPSIIALEPFEASYGVQYPLTTLLKQFQVTDNVRIEKIEITEDNYSSNYNKPGTYYVTATATDTSGNKASAVLTVNVVDKVAPKITGPKEIVTTTLSNLTKEQIRNHFTFTDDIDKNLTEYEVYDNDGYFQTPKIAGTYNFKICSIDKYGNKGYYDFELVVKDTDYPYITVDSNFTIVINQGEQISKQEIIDFLNETGLIGVAVVDVESTCFDDENPSGIYDASIILEDGTVINNKLVISSVSYNPPVIYKKEYPILLTCVITGVILLVAYFYFKRNRRNYVRR